MVALVMKVSGQNSFDGAQQRIKRAALQPRTRQALLPAMQCDQHLLFRNDHDRQRGRKLEAWSRRLGVISICGGKQEDRGAICGGGKVCLADGKECHR